MAVVIAAIVAFSSGAQAEPTLPELTAEQLVANVAAAQPAAFSGTVAITTDIGLPDLSALQNLMGQQMGGLTTLLGGTTQLKAAVDPTVGARAEIDSNTSAWVAVANVANNDAWAYISDSSSAIHLTGGTGTLSDPATALTPANLADNLIAAASPSTNFTVAASKTIAGRPAYTLGMTPSDAGSLISAVDVFIDANTWMPLGVDIWSTQLAGQPALSARFTSISYSAPPASLFDFSAPPDATVNTVDLSQPAPGPTNTDPADDIPSVKVVAGQGWASIAEVTGLPHDLAAALADPSQLSPLLGDIAQQTAAGTEYTTYLGSVLVTPSGDVFAGAVPASALESAAA